MKKIIVSILIFLPLQIISGQDKIITVQQDTIHCRIISVSPAHIEYIQKTEDGNAVGKFIPAEQVSEYLRSPQSTEITLYEPERQKSKPVLTHYFGLNFTFGMSRYVGFGQNLWERNYAGFGFEYAHRKDNTEVGIGLNISKIYTSVPLTVKQYLGDYIFLGCGLMPGYNQGLCLGAQVMIGVEFVSDSGFSFSLTPNFRFSLLNLTGKGEYAGYMADAEILQHALVTIGIGYRF